MDYGTFNPTIEVPATTNLGIQISNSQHIFLNLLEFEDFMVVYCILQITVRVVSNLLPETLVTKIKQFSFFYIKSISR